VAAWIGQKAWTLVMENAKQTGQDEFISWPASKLSKSNRFFQRSRVKEVSHPLRHRTKIGFYEI
jgi:hypothetical protein